MEKKKVSYLGLLHSLRTEGFCNELCESCQETMKHAANMLEEFAQCCAEKDAEIERRTEVVRCCECKYWDEVDEIDNVQYGQCCRKLTAIRDNCLTNYNWFCADGERKTYEQQT